MRVILTKHLTHHACAFLIRFVTCVANAGHTIEDAAVNRLEAITHIRQGTSNNHRHTVVDVRGFHLFLDVDLNDSVIVDGLHTVKSLIFVHYYI